MIIVSEEGAKHILKRHVEAECEAIGLLPHLHRYNCPCRSATGDDATGCIIYRCCACETGVVMLIVQQDALCPHARESVDAAGPDGAGVTFIDLATWFEG